MKIFYVVGIALIVLLSGFKDTEKRIKNGEVPEAVLAYIKTNYPDSRHPKYYMEVINDTTYYEVELKAKKEKLSLRLLHNGTLYEIEKAVDFKNLPPVTQENIKKELASRFQKYKIDETEFLNPHLVTQYELQVRGTIASVEKYYEFRFNAEGIIIVFKELNLKPIPTLF